jgi:DNA-binding NarL/FixJ family response regulator
LRALLEVEADFQIVGETGDGLETLRLVEALRPDILVLDLMIPGLNGLEVIHQITTSHSATRVVVLSMYQTEAYVLEALRNGAWAYVLKGSDASELVRAIRETMHHRRYLSPPLSDDTLLAYQQKIHSNSLDPYDTLTNRQRQVFQMAAEGLSNAEIGERLVISIRTVEIHRAKMMKKLGLDNHADLIRYAIKRSGILLQE